MIQIKSNWMIMSDGEGNNFPIFSLIIQRDNGEPFNCAMEASNCFKDGESALICLTSMITELIHACYPQMKDPLYRMNKELKALEECRNYLISSIKAMKKP